MSANGTHRVSVEHVLAEIERMSRSALRELRPQPPAPPLGEKVGDRLARLRKERGMSQRDISGPGASYAYISRIEAGTRNPSVKTIRVLADSLGVTPENLETGEEGLRVTVPKETVMELLWAVDAVENEVPEYLLVVADACRGVVEREEFEAYLGRQAEPLT